MKYPTVIVYLASLLAVGEPHGYMIEPPQRSSMWRVYPGFPPNYNDMELFCGGRTRQWTVNDGKCGVCGDPFDGVRKNEAGGEYATGVIGRNYTRGQIITVDIEITASHDGNFQFKICPHNNLTEPVSQACLDQNKLKLAGTNEYKYQLENPGRHSIKLQLPPNMTCSQCILQWHYTTGNSWGCAPDGTCCNGCSSIDQETYMNCADVAIFDNDNTILSTSASTIAKPTTTAPATQETSNVRPVLTKCPSNTTLMCHGIPRDDLSQQKSCNQHCRLGIIISGVQNILFDK
ncbi:uncharacterized protein LOC125680015 [Ostrea edulis]|uniref:uncharacterized protein LOC125680015 n=1 Tax=Ostrea edulis TaxID=37623 RepID=UPI0024AEBB60|nr:uncharacterized protein LOC125680015 [Ostrea edulis]